MRRSDGAQLDDRPAVRRDLAEAAAAKERDPTAIGREERAVRPSWPLTRSRCRDRRARAEAAVTRCRRDRQRAGRQARPRRGQCVLREALRRRHCDFETHRRLPVMPGRSRSDHQNPPVISTPASTPAAIAVGAHWRLSDLGAVDRRAGLNGFFEQIESDRHVANTAPAILDEAAYQQCADRFRRLGSQRLPVRFGLQHLRERIAHRRPGKGACAGQHFVEHAAEGPDVAALVGLFPSGLLGADVRRGSDNRGR